MKWWGGVGKAEGSNQTEDTDCGDKTWEENNYEERLNNNSSHSGTRHCCKHFITKVDFINPYDICEASAIITIIPFFISAKLNDFIGGETVHSSHS